MNVQQENQEIIINALKNCKPYTWLLLGEIKKLEQVETFLDDQSEYAVEADNLREVIISLKTGVGGDIYDMYLKIEGMDDDEEDCEEGCGCGIES